MKLSVLKYKVSKKNLKIFCSERDHAGGFSSCFYNSIVLFLHENFEQASKSLYLQLLENSKRSDDENYFFFLNIGRSIAKKIVRRKHSPFVIKYQYVLMDLLQILQKYYIYNREKKFKGFEQKELLILTVK